MPARCAMDAYGYPAGAIETLLARPTVDAVYDEEESR
jgi:hypothetical protein